MADLAAFLKARLDEEAEDAGLAGVRSPEWAIEEQRTVSWGDAPEDMTILAGGKPIVRVSAEYATAAAWHIARWDPARVLAEVAAKRAILADHLNANAANDWSAGTEWADEYGVPAICSRCEEDHDAALWPCPTVRALALPFAGHPDFDESWKS